MNILLLEPNYKNKYPPLGLMKISSFHKNLGDQVTFSKGIDKDLKSKLWDRIYINSLFTFEWPATKKIIEFAYTLTNDKKSIFLGGIAATLITDNIRNEEPEINIVEGLLNEPGKLDLPNDETIDSLAPDYSILDDITYKYPVEDAYFTYTTRGCGMNCSFCAVQTLEPNYVDFISITDQINEIKEHFGEKRNLMLMDNNVLKSPRLNEIVQEIINLGFGRNNATYIRPTSKREVRRYVDFNQGLDANFLTAEKANQLALLSLKPVRIAFDHINQQDKYERAIRTCFDAGLRSFSNYLLYNSDEASWKGKSYNADTPEDLYNRLEYNVNLCETLQNELMENGIDEKVELYSFPMRYIPLHDTKRGYIGTNWNKKYLRAIQVFLIPTQGKGVSSRTFFNASFGSTVDEFLLALKMPEEILSRRGKYKSKANINIEKNKEILDKFNFNQSLIQEWYNLYRTMLNSGIWDSFVSKYILGNIFNFDIFNTIENELEKKMFLYYIPPKSIICNLSKLSHENYSFVLNALSGTNYYKLINLEDENK